MEKKNPHAAVPVHIPSIGIAFIHWLNTCTSVDLSDYTVDQLLVTLLPAVYNGDYTITIQSIMVQRSYNLAYLVAVIPIFFDKLCNL